MAGEASVGGAVSRAVAALERAAFLLERQNASSYRVAAFRKAASTVRASDDADLTRRTDTGTLQEIPGLGPATAGVAGSAVAGRRSDYLEELEEAPWPGSELEVGGLGHAIRGDLHTHSDWSDGGSPIAQMALAAKQLGREYIAITDHSPRLTVANGLTAERLARQLDVVAGLNQRLAPFRILTGIEVDILDDGSLDQDDQLLERLDVVVASVHSKLRMDRESMTRRMLRAVANPRTNVLGHCTGRMVTGSKNRPESTFDAEAVFAACAEHQVAVEVNCRPERLDPPRRLLSLALDVGCLVAIDTDAHAPGQLAWSVIGVDRAAQVGVPVESVVTSWSAAQVVAWTGRAG